MKEQLEQFKKLNEMFKNRAEQIAILKNKYTYNFKYDYINNMGYIDDEWEIEFVKRQRCEDNTYKCYITEKEMLTDLSELEIEYKDKYDKKIAEQERLKKELEEKRKKEKEKAELELFNKLKEKYEN